MDPTDLKLPTIAFSHWYFTIGVLTIALTVLATRIYWRPGNKQRRVRRRQWVLYVGGCGQIILLPLMMSVMLGLGSGLAGGTGGLRLALESTTLRLAPTVGQLTAVALFSVVVALIFPVITHRMHGYSGHANRLVLQLSKFYNLELLSILLMLFIIVVHGRVIFANMVQSALENPALQSFCSILGAYNVADGMLLIALVLILIHEFHSFMKRCADNLSTVQLVARAGGVIANLLEWNTDPHYRARKLPDEAVKYKSRRETLPQYKLTTEDQLWVFLLTADIGAVARKTARGGDMWGTLKAIEVLDGILVQARQALPELHQTSNWSILSRTDGISEKSTRMALPHAYVVQREPLIEHVVQELDQVVTIATSGGGTHLLVDILERYERRVLSGINDARTDHDADWCFFVLSRGRRFFYLQMTYNNPWLARNVIEMQERIARAAISGWASEQFSIDHERGQFFDCCLSHVLSSLRKFFSMAIISDEASLLRVTTNTSLSIFRILVAEEHPNVGRARGSIVRMLVSACMFALERSRGACGEIVLDGLVRMALVDQASFCGELEEIFGTHWRSNGVTDDVSIETIVRSQLADPGNPKLDLDREDLLVNLDSLCSCALAVLDLTYAYSQTTDRERAIPEKFGKKLPGILSKQAEGYASPRRKWLSRAKSGGAVLMVDAADAALERLG